MSDGVILFRDVQNQFNLLITSLLINISKFDYVNTLLLIKNSLIQTYNNLSPEATWEIQKSLFFAFIAYSILFLIRKLIATAIAIYVILFVIKKLYTK